MIRLYFHHTPNPMKVALFLEETGLPYEVVPVDTYKGEQHTPEFRAINPNAKTPAIIDSEGLGKGPVTVFDSSAILLYLAEKAGKLLGPREARGELLSWLMFVASGLGPFSANLCTFDAPLRSKFRMRRTAIYARLSGTIEYLTSSSPAEISSWPANTQSPTSLLGAGSIGQTSYLVRGGLRSS